MQSIITAKIKYGDEDVVLHLPCKDGDLEAQRNRLTEDPNAEFYLSAIEPTGLAPLAGQDVDLDELNFLAKSMERFTEDEEAQFFAAVQVKLPHTLKEAINLSFNLERFTVVRELTNLAQIGKKHLLNVQGCITQEDMDTLDFAGIGRRVLGSSQCIPTDYGLLHENLEVPVQQVYNGTTFPCYIFRSDEVAVCTLQYGDKTEYLYLPEEDISIEKALSRLGADTLADCEIAVESTIVSHAEWLDWFGGILDHEGLSALNSLAGFLNKEGLDWDKLTALVQYADVVSAEDIIKLAKNQDDFIFIKDAETDADVGHYFVDYHNDYSASPALEDFINFEALGSYLQQELDSEWLECGLVCMEPGCSLKHILNENTQDFMMGGIP